MHWQKCYVHQLEGFFKGFDDLFVVVVVIVVVIAVVVVFVVVIVVVGPASKIR